MRSSSRTEMEEASRSFTPHARRETASMLDRGAACGARVPLGRGKHCNITTQSTTMRLHTLSRPLQPSSLLCIALALVPVVHASLGDRQPDFKSCVHVSSQPWKLTMRLLAM